MTPATMPASRPRWVQQQQQQLQLQLQVSHPSTLVADGLCPGGLPSRPAHHPAGQAAPRYPPPYSAVVFVSHGSLPPAASLLSPLVSQPWPHGTRERRRGLLQVSRFKSHRISRQYEPFMNASKQSLRRNDGCRRIKHLISTHLHPESATPYLLLAAALR